MQSEKYLNMPLQMDDQSLKEENDFLKQQLQILQAEIVMMSTPKKKHYTFDEEVLTPREAQLEMTPTPKVHIQQKCHNKELNQNDSDNISEALRVVQSKGPDYDPCESFKIQVKKIQQNSTPKRFVRTEQRNVVALSATKQSQSYKSISPIKMKEDDEQINLDPLSRADIVLKEIEVHQVSRKQAIHKAEMMLQDFVPREDVNKREEVNIIEEIREAPVPEKIQTISEKKTRQYQRPTSSSTQKKTSFYHKNLPKPVLEETPQKQGNQYRSDLQFSEQSLKKYISRTTAKPVRREIKKYITNEYKSIQNSLGVVPIKDLNLQRIKKQLIEEQKAKEKQERLNDKMKRIEAIKEQKQQEAEERRKRIEQKGMQTPLKNQSSRNSVCETSVEYQSEPKKREITTHNWEQNLRSSFQIQDRNHILLRSRKESHQQSFQELYKDIRVKLNSTYFESSERKVSVLKQQQQI